MFTFLSSPALPPEATSIWEAYPFIFGNVYCYIKVFIPEMTSYASVLTITAFTIDRYVAICHPLRSQALSSLSRAVKIIILIWVVACACALPYPFHTRTFYEMVDPCTKEPLHDSFLCNIPSDYRHRMKYMFQFSTFVFFIIPMIIITIMYVLIGLTLMKTDQFTTGKKNKQASIAAAKAKKAVLKMLVAVVIAFFACWAPFHTQRLMTLFVPPDAWTDTLLNLQTDIFYVSGVLYFFSSTINPILYNVMSNRYRQAFKKTLYVCFKGKSYEYSETSFFRSTPQTTSVTVYTNHRLLVKDRLTRNGDIEMNDSTNV
ncbi:Pyrokinin-1 receptor [Bulinus truncatus]|nr:Pyrokinin-1 receptor [Bulinus truncatus]